jgi:APA family basic amino acid/polyamine antiporter
MTAGFSAAIATAALLFSKYLATLVPGIDGVVAQKIIASLLIGLIACMHGFDTKLGGRVQEGFTIMKVLLIVVFIVLGLLSGNGDWSHFDSVHGGVAENLPTLPFAISLMYVSFAYSGWNAAAYIAGEVEKPEKNLPRSLLLGTGAVMLLYVLLNLVYFYALSPKTLAGPDVDAQGKFLYAPIIEVGAAAAQSLFGTAGGNAITTLIAIALVSAVSAMVMAGPRVYAAMAADRALPHQLAWHSKRGVPTVAVAAQAVLGIAFVMVGEIAELMRFAGFTLAVFAALTVGALFILRARGMKGPYRTLLYPLTPIVFIGSSAWIAYAQIKQNPKESLVVAAVLVVGGILYKLMVPPSRDPEPPKVPEARLVDG